MGTVAFTKTYLNPAQHLAMLKSRGLQITDENLATAYLTNVGYYRLSAYFPVFRNGTPISAIS